MKKYFTTLALFLLFQCNSNKSDSSFLLNNLGISVFNNSRVSVSGQAVKGIVKNGLVSVFSVKADGSCDTSNPIATTLTNLDGNYSLRYNKTGSLVCVSIKGNTVGTSSVYDEVLKSDAPLAANSNFKLETILSESKLTSATKKSTLSLFSNLISARLKNLVQANGGRVSSSSLLKKASKEAVIRFGLNTGFSSASRNFKPNQKNILDTNYPEYDDIEYNFADPKNLQSNKFISIAAGISYLANKYKKGPSTTTEDLDSVISAFTSDFEDGIFDGKTATGTNVTLGTGSNQITFSSTPLTTILLPAIESFVSEGGRLSLGGSSSITLSLTQLSQIQFIDNAPIFSNDPSLSPGFSLVTSSYKFFKNFPITNINPNAVDSINSCYTIPSLPTGLTISSKCVISGTPIVNQPATNFLIVGKNGTENVGSVSVNIQVESLNSLYVLNRTDANLRIYNTGDDGNLVFVSTFPTGLTNPNGVIYNGKHVVVVSPTVIRSYLRNADGTLTFVNSIGTADTTTTCTSTNCYFHPSGSTFYVWEPGGALVRFASYPINSSGFISARTELGFNDNIILGPVHPSGTKLLTFRAAAAVQDFFSLDSVGNVGAATTISPIITPDFYAYPDNSSCDFSNNGNFLYCGQRITTIAYNRVTQYSVNASANTLTPLSPFEMNTANEGQTSLQTIKAIKLSPNNNHLYVYGKEFLWSFNVNTTTGLINPTAISQVRVPNNCPADQTKIDLAIHPNGNTLYAICCSTGVLSTIPLVNGSMGVPVTLNTAAAGSTISDAQRLLFVPGL
ncbi:MAG: hypothetical protein SFU98_09820 [Leptospiraceae bacterium]|nr:hypothetical protein [Leptospiraceae bacterium]